MNRSLFAVLFLTILPVACGESNAEADETWVPKARARFEAGDLEGAERFASLSAGAAADQLRAEITKARIARDELDQEIARIMGPAKAASAKIEVIDSARTSLNTLREETKDPVSREHISKAIEQLRTMATALTPVEPTIKPTAEPQVSAAVKEIKATMLTRDWKKGFELLKVATDNKTATPEELEEVRKQLIDGGVRELNKLVSSVIQTEQTKGSKAAYDLVKAASARFPDLPDFETLPGLLHDLARRAGVPEDK